MKTLFLTIQLLFLLVGLSLSNFSQTQADFLKAKEVYETGNAAINRGDFEQGIENYSAAIKLYPYVPEFFFNRAVAYRTLRKFDLAISDLNKILELTPNLPFALWKDVYFLLGTVHQENGNYDKAIENLNRAIFLEPNDPKYYLNRANTYQFMKKLDLALADYNRSIELRPYALTYYNRGRMFHEIKDFEKSISDYSKAIELNPQYADAFSNRGLAYQDKGSFDMALDDYTKAISLGPKDGVYYFNRANIYVKRGNFRFAIADYTKSIEIYPLWAEPLRRRANAYMKTGNKRMADLDLQKARTVEKENFNPVNKTEIVFTPNDQ